MATASARVRVDKGGVLVGRESPRLRSERERVRGEVAVKTIEWRADSVRMIDQRLLPGREVIRTYRDYRGVAEAIRTMVIRGAPAIGVAAAMGVALGIKGFSGERAR